MKRLYHVRHGLSVMNKSGKVSSFTDTPLAPEGIEQAKQAGILARDYNINVIVSSPLIRAHDTAKIIAKHAGVPEDKILVNPLLTERSYGALEGTEYSELRKKRVDTYEGVEPWSEVKKRAEAALEWIKGLEEDNVLVVTHGSFGRALRTLVKPDVEFHVKLGNAEVEKWL